MQENLQRMSQTEENLQKALVSEASLKTSLAEQQNQNKAKLALLDEAKETKNHTASKINIKVMLARQYSLLFLDMLPTYIYSINKTPSLFPSVCG